MTIYFKYKTVKRPDGTKVKSPSVPIILIGKEDTIETLALLDSGADISAISKDFAEILGLNLEGKKTPAFGIGGKVDSIQTNINIKIGNAHENYVFKIPIKVILDTFDFPPLLGRVGFFDKFVISFHNSKKK